MTHFIYFVLRAIISIILIFKSLNKVFKISFLFSFFNSFIGRLRGRLYNYFGFAVYFFTSFSRAIFNTFIILYTVTPFNFTRSPLIHSLRAYKNLFYIFNYYAINIIIVLYISYITIMRLI